YIEEVRQATASRDASRHAATGHAEESAGATQPRQLPTGRDEPRQDAASKKMLSRYVARLGGGKEFLRGQIAVKGEEIKEQTERARETNILIGGLQKMLTPLLGRGGTSPLDHSQPPDMENRG